MSVLVLVLLLPGRELWSLDAPTIAGLWVTRSESPSKCAMKQPAFDTSLPLYELVADAVKRSSCAHMFHFYTSLCETASDHEICHTCGSWRIAWPYLVGTPLARRTNELQGLRLTTVAGRYRLLQLLVLLLRVAGRAQT